MLSIVMDLQNNPIGLQFESNTLVKTTFKFYLTKIIVVETILLNTLLGLRIERVAENNLMIIADIAGKLVTVKDIALDFDPMRDFGITMNVNNMVVGVKFERDGLKTITAAVVLDKIELVTDFMTQCCFGTET